MLQIFATIETAESQPSLLIYMAVLTGGLPSDGLAEGGLERIATVSKTDCGGKFCLFSQD